MAKGGAKSKPKRGAAKRAAGKAGKAAPRGKVSKGRKK
jgi:hypothetical protein